jgi:hypothetical protein
VLGTLGTHSAEELKEATWITESLEGVKVVVGESGLELRFMPVR